MNTNKLTFECPYYRQLQMQAFVDVRAAKKMKKE